MSAPIGPGDWVECVERSKRRDWLTPGRIYRVHSIVPGPFPDCEFGVILVAPMTPWPFGWSNRLFRPIYRPRADLIESLLAPAPAPPVKVEA